LNNPITLGALKIILEPICELGIYPVTKQYDKSNCKGLIRNEVFDFMLPMVYDEMFSAKNWCSFRWQVCETDKYKPVDLDAWVDNKINEKTDLAKSNDFVNNLYETIKDKKGDVKVAVISDLHMDYDYTPGMATGCDKPVCCRSDSGLPKDPSKGAGKWGDYNCDLNERMLLTLLDKVRSLKPDAVLWVGDTIPHNLDSLTFKSNVEII
jgi:hypothetical protein